MVATLLERMRGGMGTQRIGVWMKTIDDRERLTLHADLTRRNLGADHLSRLCGAIATVETMSCETMVVAVPTARPLCRVRTRFRRGVLLDGARLMPLDSGPVAAELPDRPVTD